MVNNICDKNLEKIVLGSLMSTPEILSEIREILTEDCFTEDTHKTIFKAILAINNSGDEPTLTSVALRLKNTVKMSFLAEILNEAQYSNNITYAKLLTEYRMRRELQELGNYLISKSADTEIDISETIGYADSSLSNVFGVKSENIYTIKQAIKEVFKIADQNARGESLLTGTPTGISEFDRKSGGLQKSDLIIIGAESSQGKTSLAITMMKNAAETGAKVAMYSMEMKKEQIASRMMSMESGIPSNEILFSRLNSSQFSQLDRSIVRLYDMPIYFDDSSTSSIDKIISSIRSMKMKHNIDGVVIDYLQILNVNMKGTNKEQQMADVARRLKNLAKDLNIWIIALSQLNRDANNPVPNLNRLRDSGQIAEAADIVMFIYRPEEMGRSFPDPFSQYDTRGMAMIDIAKGRNIGVLKFLLSFNPQTTHFKNPEQLFEKQEIINDDKPF